MDDGNGRLKEVTEENKQKHIDEFGYPPPIFTMDEELFIKGSHFIVKEIREDGLLLKLLPRTHKTKNQLKAERKKKNKHYGTKIF